MSLPRHPFAPRRSRRPYSSTREKPVRAPSPPPPQLKDTARTSSSSAAATTDSFAHNKRRRSSFRRVGKFLSRVVGRASSPTKSTSVSGSSLPRDSSRSSSPPLRTPVGERERERELAVSVRAQDPPTSPDSAFQADQDDLRTYWFGDKTPGATGLRNHGNTCYMNAVLQCLSHTDILAAYFGLNRYKEDLRLKKKKLGPGYRRGTEGELTDRLAVVIRSLWSGQYDASVSTDFKSTVEKYGTQYKGGAQHDAQEFLLWLLDKVHEDLNIARKRRYKHMKGSGCRAEEVQAAESLNSFLRCNDSFVHSLFQAQFRSSLTCPHCRQQSNTFDPFLCLSLPIPQASRRPVFVSVVYLSQQPRQVKLGFSMDCDASIRELRETVARDTGINVDRCVLAEVDGEGFRRTFSDNQSLNAIDVNDRVHGLYALEMPDKRESSEADGEFVSIVFVNVLCTSEEEEESKEDEVKTVNSETRFGSPHVSQMRREMSYSDFQKLLLKEMQAMLHPSILTTDQEIPLFRIEVYTGEREGEPLDADLDLPLYAEAVDQALSLSDPDGDGQYGPKHIKLVLKWGRESKDRVIFDDAEHMDEHASVRELQDNPQLQPPVTLEECFRIYTSEEVLGPDNAWLCPNCNKKGKGIKKLALWSLPDILIIHLKRFKQWNSNGVMTAKLTTPVDFPKTNFDVSSHLATVGEQRNQENGGGASGKKDGRSGKSGVFQRVFRRMRPTKQKGVGTAVSTRRRPRPDECSYELYAAINHHGSDDQGGHYTAFCRNSTDGNWYRFDDHHVSKLDEADVVTDDAYILFYRRKDPSCSFSSASLGPSSTLPTPRYGASSTLPLSFAKSHDPHLSVCGTLPSSWNTRSTGKGQHHWVYDIPGLTPVKQVPKSESRSGSSGEEDSGVMTSDSIEAQTGSVGEES